MLLFIKAYIFYYSIVLLLSKSKNNNRKINIIIVKQHFPNFIKLIKIIFPMFFYNIYLYIASIKIYFIISKIKCHYYIINKSTNKLIIK